MPISLHIFEDRYKLMIGRCIAERKPFGVLSLEQGTAEFHLGQGAVPYTIGCTAHITQVQQAGEGRLNIVAFGHERFQVLAFDHSQPYLMGTVEIMPFSVNDLAAFSESAQQLRPLIVRYVSMVSRFQDEKFDANLLPEDPVQLAYLAAALLRTSTDDKQKILDASDAAAMLDDLAASYRRENTLLGVFDNLPSHDSDQPFSLN
jgi:Lon protease-like protein